MRDLLNTEMEAQYSGIQTLKLGSIEHEKANAGLTKLIEKEVDYYKFETERKDKLEQQKKQEELQRVKDELDRIEKQNQYDLQIKQLELQQKQFDEQVKQNKRSKWTTVLQILAPVGVAAAYIAVNIWGTKYTTDKEMNDGVIQTTEAGKSHTRQLLNKK